MSLFCESLTRRENAEFQRRKRKFKAGKPCAICGAKLAPERMMVAHLVPVRELTNQKALFNEENWEVRCIDCERNLHHAEQLRENSRKKPTNDLKTDALQEKRKQEIGQRKQYRNIRSAQAELAIRKMSHKPHRKRVRKHPKDDYYDEPFDKSQ